VGQSAYNFVIFSRYLSNPSVNTKVPHPNSCEE